MAGDPRAADALPPPPVVALSWPRWTPGRALAAVALLATGAYLAAGLTLLAALGACRPGAGCAGSPDAALVAGAGVAAAVGPALIGLLRRRWGWAALAAAALMVPALVAWRVLA